MPPIADDFRLLAHSTEGSISHMSNAKESWLQKASPELVAVLSLGVTILLAVLGQTAWLDGRIDRVDAKIDRVDAKLSAQIEGLQQGQTAIRERLAALEARSGVALSPIAGNKESPGSAL